MTTETQPAEPRLLADGKYVVIDDMTWPGAGDANGDLEHILRYGTPTRSQLLVAASVLSAYRQMVADPASKRAYIVRQLRKAKAMEGEVKS